MVSASCGMTTRSARATIGTLAHAKATTLSQRQMPCSLTSNVTLRGGIVKTVTLEVRSPAESMAGFVQAWRTGKPEKSARISFATPELLWKVLTAKRWELLKALCGTGPMSIREAARRVGRDVKAVHSDITALLAAGILDRTESGAIVFPFEAVRSSFCCRLHRRRAEDAQPFHREDLHWPLMSIVGRPKTSGRIPKSLFGNRF